MERGITRRRTSKGSIEGRIAASKEEGKKEGWGTMLLGTRSGLA